MRKDPPELGVVHRPDARLQRSPLVGAITIGPRHLAEPAERQAAALVGAQRQEVADEVLRPPWFQRGADQVVLRLVDDTSEGLVLDPQQRAVLRGERQVVIV